MSNGIGKIITFDGPDGSGKTTQVEKTRQYLSELGFDVLVCQEQYSLPACQGISDVNLHSQLDDLTRLYLYQAMRWETFFKLIYPALTERKIVLLDRFVGSTLTYQGYAANKDEDHFRLVQREVIEMLNRFNQHSAKPFMNFMLLISPEEALKRMKAVKKLDVFENWNMDRKQKVYDGYRKSAEFLNARIIHTHISVEEVFARIKYDIDMHFVPNFQHLIKKQVGEAL